jgi:hypothetical protein
MVKAVARSAGQALSLLIVKSKAHGCFHFDAYTNLYESLVWSVISYGAAIMGTRGFSCINAVQHRAIRFFFWVLVNILLMTPLMGIWVGNLRVLSIGVVFLDTGLDVMLCLRTE